MQKSNFNGELYWNHTSAAQLYWNHTSTKAVYVFIQNIYFVEHPQRVAYTLQLQFTCLLSMGGFHVNSVSFDIKMKQNTIYGSNREKYFLKHPRAKNSFLIDETLYYVETTPPFIILIIHPIIPHTYPFLMHFRTLVHWINTFHFLVSRLLLSNYWRILFSIASGVARNCKN